MKIEIEADDLIALKNENNALKKALVDKQSQLDKLDEKKLKQDAEVLAIYLFQSYIKCVFTSLGFNTKNSSHTVSIDHHELERLLGKKWHEFPERIHISLEGHITEKFKAAFLKIGVKLPEEEDVPPYGPNVFKGQ